MKPSEVTNTLTNSMRTTIRLLELGIECRELEIATLRQAIAACSAVAAEEILPRNEAEGDLALELEAETSALVAGVARALGEPVGELEPPARPEGSGNGSTLRKAMRRAEQ